MNVFQPGQEIVITILAVALVKTGAGFTADGSIRDQKWIL